MQLDRMTIALRERYSWEAMDLGIQLMRSLWPVLFIPWLIVISLVLSLCIYLQLNEYPVLGVFLLWWLKPIYDSLVLHILSRGIFAEYPTTREVFSSYRSWLKTGILTSVFWWRLSPSRSFNLAIHQLESLGGSKRRQRLRVLHRNTGSHAAGLTIIGLHFELLVNLTFYFLLFSLIPQQYAGSFFDLFTSSDENVSGIIMNTFFYGLTIFILEPFYVASGFTLYLNRRTQLEGWDIELAFRKLADKHIAKSAPATARPIAQVES